MNLIVFPVYGNSSSDIVLSCVPASLFSTIEFGLSVEFVLFSFVLLSIVVLLIIILLSSILLTLFSLTVLLLIVLLSISISFLGTFVTTTLTVFWFPYISLTITSSVLFLSYSLVSLFLFDDSSQPSTFWSSLLDWIVTITLSFSVV